MVCKLLFSSDRKMDFVYPDMYSRLDSFCSLEPFLEGKGEKIRLSDDENYREVILEWSFFVLKHQQK